MLNEAKEFLNLKLSRKKKYLLGFSGGPDSTALFQLLVEGGYQFHVVHIDHGWREESYTQALQLKRMIEGEYHVPFHLHKLEDQDITLSNLEDKAREERLRVFHSLYRENSFDGLLLGHTEDDQAETIIKRIFEGAYFVNMQGIKDDVFRDGMRVLRPLLYSPKKEIVKWLSSRRIPYLEDSSNNDLRFLRPRIRKKMRPLLEEIFGKSISRNLMAFSKSMKRAESYLEKRIQVDFKDENNGFSVSLPPETEELEIEYLFRMILKKQGLPIRRCEVERMIEIVKENRGGKKILIKDMEIKYVQKCLYFTRVPKEVLTLKG